MKFPEGINNGQAACGGFGVGLFEPLIEEMCAGSMAPADARLRGLGICEEEARTGKGPGRGSVWAGDLASERAESPSHTDPDSLRDPCLIFLLQDRRKAPLGFSDQCPSVVHSVRLVRNCIQAFHPPS